MLKIRGLESCYGESCIVSGLTFDVPKGEIVGLIGRNGVGKSTTLKSIMGLVKTPHGAIELDGEDIIRRPTYERAAAGLGYVPQGRDIFPQMTVQENLELALYAQPEHREAIAKATQQCACVYEEVRALNQFLEREGCDVVRERLNRHIVQFIITSLITALQGLGVPPRTVQAKRTRHS